MTQWTLTYEGFDPEAEGLREALCTLGNGYFASRGAATEQRAGDVHYPGTYVEACTTGSAPRWAAGSSRTRISSTFPTGCR